MNCCIRRSRHTLVQITFSAGFPSCFILFPLFSDFCHQIRIKNLFQLFLSHDPLFQNKFPDRLASFYCSFCDGCRRLVANMRTKCCCDSALLSIRSLQCLRFAVIPVMQFTINVSTAFSRVVMDSKRLQNTTGSKAFNSSCPASAAMVMVVSCPTM